MAIENQGRKFQRFEVSTWHAACRASREKEGLELNPKARGVGIRRRVGSRYAVEALLVLPFPKRPSWTLADV